MHVRSPLAPAEQPRLPPLAGVRIATGCSGMRYRGRDDVALIELAPSSTIAGVFTRSLCSSAPVDWCRRRVARGRARAIVVNAGNANAFTGRDGDRAVSLTARGVGAALRCPADQVFVASTGVIGVKLPAEKITAMLPALNAALSPDAWDRAAAAIMTTDTFPKVATATAEIAGTKVTINGIAKGSGMIAPDMATMLGFVFTDAAIPAPALAALLREATAASFNCITVDGDTSTSDTLLMCATGQTAHQKVVRASDRHLRDFRVKLTAVLVDLAHQIVKDGEGAEKFVSVTVTGAQSPRAARAIGMSIANSPLVKTALAAGDANWGRIVMAVGKAGQKANRDKLAIRIGGVAITAKGALVPGYDEEPVARHLAGREVAIEVDVGVGKGRATVWTCDLTHRYIDINASYRS